MKILGIDPGYDRLGLAVIEKLPKKKEVLLYSDCFQTSAKDSLYNRFLQIGKKVEQIIEEYKPDTLAIETLFIDNNQKTAMRVSEVRGIIIYEAIKRGILVYEFSPLQIKSAVSGSGRSDKTQMIKMVHMLIEIPAKKTRDDEYDAIAVALSCAATHK